MSSVTLPPSLSYPSLSPLPEGRVENRPLSWVVVVRSGRVPCSLNSVSAMLIKKFVWLTQRSALGREPSLSHGLMILLQILWLGRGNLYIYIFFFFFASFVCYSRVSTLLYWVKWLRIFLLPFRLYAVRRFGPKSPLTCRLSLLCWISILCSAMSR
jgi:hypothetical protein